VCSPSTPPIEILPLAVSVESARPHDLSAGSRLLAMALPKLGTVQGVIATAAPDVSARWPRTTG
jgi:hypothetical protein